MIDVEASALRIVALLDGVIAARMSTVGPRRNIVPPQISFEPARMPFVQPSDDVARGWIDVDTARSHSVQESIGSESVTMSSSEDASSDSVPVVERNSLWNDLSNRPACRGTAFGPCRTAAVSRRIL